MNKSEMIFVKATVDDADALAEIRCEFLDEVNAGLDAHTINGIDTACKEYFRYAIADGSFVAWLAEDGDKIIGTSGICFYTVPPNKSCPNGKVAYIQNMYTKLEYRKRGIANTLFSKMIDEAKCRGCTQILLNATDAGRPIYEKFGFTDTKGDMKLQIQKE